LTDNWDSVPVNVQPFCWNGNSTSATAETWHLEGRVLKVKLFLEYIPELQTKLKCYMGGVFKITWDQNLTVNVYLEKFPDLSIQHLW